MKKFKLPLVIACVAVIMVMIVAGEHIERERISPTDNISDTETETICETEAPKSEETTTKEVAEETEQIETTKTQTTTTSATSSEVKQNVPMEEDNSIDTSNETTTVSEVKSSYIGNLKVTGYTDEEGFTYGSTTASGIPIGEGMCALNNTQRQELGISYGDKIYINGLGTYTVVDCGCRYGVVDVWFWTNAEAYAVTGYYDVYFN